MKWNFISFVDMHLLNKKPLCTLVGFIMWSGSTLSRCNQCTVAGLKNLAIKKAQFFVCNSLYLFICPIIQLIATPNLIVTEFHRK